MGHRRWKTRTLRHLATGAVACLLCTAALTATASASAPIESFITTTSNTQAGGHPNLSMSFRLANPGEPEAARNVYFKAPEGIFGNPNAITNCTPADFSLDRCPPNSQAGLITVYDNEEGNPQHLLGTAPLFILEPSGDQTALLAFITPTLNIPILIPVTVRTGSDFGLTFTVSEITQTTPVSGVDLTIWGFPALETHDTERFRIGSPGEPSNCPGLTDASCLGTPLRASIPVHPLTDNPTTCTGEPLQSTLEVQSYQDPANRSKETATYPATDRCDLEVFNPVLYARPTVDETDAPSGLDLELSAPQFLGFAASPSQLKKVIVTFPEGFTINPDAADGQTMCTEAQANFGSEGPANCPDTSKIGTFSIGTQALDGRLEGAIYIGEPKPGNQYRLFQIASGFGMNVKLVGSVKPDPVTGQLTGYFEGLPQVPFDDFQLHLFAADRGLMATPTHCTIYATRAVFYPWNTTLAEQESTQTFGLSRGPGGSSCPGTVRPFSPRLGAGTSNPDAGAFSSFTLKLDRDDGDQFLGKLNFTMPPGLTARLGGISYCPEAGIAAAAQNDGRTELVLPSCPAQSQIGTTNVAAGPGSHPFHAVGKMYLAGPFKGAPLSLVAITPALAGPYDYGVVVVRVAIQVDPLDAHVVADSETVPEIIGGIPIRMRSIRVKIDKPNFMINPTNCSPFTVDSQGIGNQGTVTDFSSFFQAVNCRRLSFRPKMAITQIGNKMATRRSTNPALRFDLWTRDGDANVKSLSVTLSKAFEIDQRHLGNICSEKELAEKECAGRAPIGKASTKTPLLDQPLSGPVYAVSGSGGLPRLAFILNGQVNLMPRADTTTATGRLKTTVPVVPDAPIGHFSMTVFGGKNGYLINTRDICKDTAGVKVIYTGQNGKRRNQNVDVKAKCAGRKKQQGRRR